MAIRYTLVNTETGTAAATGFPTNAAQTTNFGFNVPGGPLESVIFRFTGTKNAAGDIDQDFAGAISSLRVIVNGETCFDHRSGYNDPANDTTASQMGYFMNSIGNHLSSEVVASSTAVEAYFRVPLGRQLPAGVSRIEYTLGTAAIGGASTNTQVELWCVYNSSMQTRTTVAAATSFTAGGTGQEEVVVRIPANQPGVIAGVMIQNDRDTDADLSEVRVLSQSDYSLEMNYWRYLNSDLDNGVMYGTPGAGGAALLSMNYAQLSPGGYFIPLFGLSRGDDLRLQITTTSAQTFLFTPVLVASVGASDMPDPMQTQAVPSNTSRAILDISGQADA